MLEACQCWSKRAQARQKCETDKCAVKHTKYQSEIFLSEEKFIDHKLEVILLKSLQNLFATDE